MYSSRADTPPAGLMSWKSGAISLRAVAVSASTSACRRCCSIWRSRSTRRDVLVRSELLLVAAAIAVVDAGDDDAVGSSGRAVAVLIADADSAQASAHAIAE